MDIHIEKVVRGLDGGRSVARKVFFDVDWSGDGQSLYMFHLALDRQGCLYVNNDHFHPKRRNGEYGGDPLNLYSSDRESLDAVVNHWQDIRSQFVRVVSHGAPMIGHLSTSYFFPDGSRKEYKPKNNPMKMVDGPSLDDQFPSEGCKYIGEHPYEQHYRIGRFHVYLEQDSVTLEDDVTIQVFDETCHHISIVQKLLEFIAEKPETALDRLLVRN